MKNTIEFLYQLFLKSNGICTDTRSIKNNQIFFALKGDNFNANQLAQNAIKLGAAYAVIDEEKYKENEHYIVVDNTLDTLQQLALYHRNQINLIALIAITGSNGKTTTKELLHAVLKTEFKTHATVGNLNNHIGVPLTLLAMPFDTEIAIIEMGANHQKEIASYCSFTHPTHGVITNIGKAHLEGFGGVEGIKKGKGELFDFLKEHNGIPIYNADDTILEEMIQNRNFNNIEKYSTQQIQLVEDYPNIIISIEDNIIKSNLFGQYNLYNILCAIRTGQLFNVTIDKIKDGIENYFPNNKRSEFVQEDNYKLILDYYNANPTSMQHALENFSLSKAKNRIVILGDMFELGDNTALEHQSIADLAATLGFEKIVLIGKNFANTKTDTAIKMNDAIEAKTWFKNLDKSNAEILIKGSRGMKMENVISE
jgi:UDP-N-acetylmuramoyl-tripeptide--D-alanyl-D-alanine ligase